jgi:hypothetical protein
MEDQPTASEAKGEPSPEDIELTESLLASDDELERAYGEAYQAGCFVKEFGGDSEEQGLAGVGEMETLFRIEQQTGEEINPAELSLGDCVALAYPGSGRTRAESVRDGLRQVLEAREKAKKPEELDLYSSFTENGYKVEAFMPRSSSQTLQWTLKVTRDGEEEPCHTETFPMLHEPIFGVYDDDQTTLEEQTDRIMRELAGE